MPKTKTTLIRFNTPHVASRFARALRRQGFEVQRNGFDVIVKAKRLVAEQALRQWAIRRGGIPVYTVMEW